MEKVQCTNVCKYYNASLGRCDRYKISSEYNECCILKSRRMGEDLKRHPKGKYTKHILP